MVEVQRDEGDRLTRLEGMAIKALGKIQVERN